MHVDAHGNQRWENRVVSRDSASPEELQGWLDAGAIEGWLLCSAFPDPYRPLHAVIYFFRRPVPAMDPQQRGTTTWHSRSSS